MQSAGEARLAGPPPPPRPTQDSGWLPGGPSPLDTLFWARPLHPNEQKWGWGPPGPESRSLPQVRSVVPTTRCGHLSGKDSLLLAELSCDLRVWGSLATCAPLHPG